MSVLVTGVLLAVATPASDALAANAQSPLRLISPGLANLPATFKRASTDGSRVFFESAEAIPGSGDTDTATDVYEGDADGALRLISPGSANLPATFKGASADGSRVYFTTMEALPGTADAGTGRDVYERDADGTLRLISAGGSFAEFNGASADGSRVFFAAFEAIPGTGDADTRQDVYERDADGTLRLVTVPTSANSESGNEFFDAVTADGSVFFDTREAIPGTGDIDTADDAYVRKVDGSLRLVTTPESGSQSELFEGVSADGRRVYFNTLEAIPGTGDTGTESDVYERELEFNGLRLISFHGGRFDGAVPDGRVFFTTNIAIPGTGDADAGQDVYERDLDGTVRLVTTPSSGSVPEFFGRVTTDGNRVIFSTDESLTALDPDAAADIYARDADGTLRLMSGAAGNSDVIFRGASADGSRVFFETAEAIPGTGDTDTVTDVYEGDLDGTVRLVTTPSLGVAASFSGASADGSSVFFGTAEAIPGTGDADTALDVYEHRFLAPSFASDASITGTPATGSTLTCVPGQIIGENVTTTTEWLRDGAPVAGALGSAYLVADADIGHLLACRVTASNSVGSATQASAAVLADPVRPPAFASDPRATGAPVVGSTLTCVPGQITGENVTTTIEWLRDGTLLAGALGRTYVATDADVGHGLACRVTATNAVGSATKTSSAVTIEAAMAIDRSPPSVRILTPRCPRKAARRACRGIQVSVRAWRTLHGTVSDAVPSSGIARVEVNIVRRLGSRCFVYTGQRFAATACRKAGRRYVHATLSGNRWSLRLKRLVAGRYRIRARAVDRSGNRTPRPATRVFALR